MWTIFGQRAFWIFEGSHFWLLVLTPLLAFIRSLAALELGQGLGTAMIMVVMMVTFDSLRAVNLAATLCVTKLGLTSEIPQAQD